VEALRRLGGATLTSDSRAGLPVRGGTPVPSDGRPLTARSRSRAGDRCRLVRCRCLTAIADATRDPAAAAADRNDGDAITEAVRCLGAEPGSITCCMWCSYALLSPGCHGSSLCRGAYGLTISHSPTCISDRPVGDLLVQPAAEGCAGWIDLDADYLPSRNV